MRWTTFLVVAGCCVSGLSCASTKPPSAEEMAKLTDNQAAVYIGERYRGLTPREVRVRPSFGETRVTLRRGAKVVRIFDIEWTTRSGSYLPYLFGTDTEGEAAVYNLEDLEQQSDSTYTIPHLSVPIKVRDRQYGLTVWVEG